jgi:hypothetical protein
LLAEKHKFEQREVQNGKLLQIIVRRKTTFIAIPGEARNLLLAKGQEKADSSGKHRPRNDRVGSLSAFSKGCEERERPWNIRVKHF